MRRAPSFLVRHPLKSQVIRPPRKTDSRSALHELVSRYVDSVVAHNQQTREKTLLPPVMILTSFSSLHHPLSLQCKTTTNGSKTVPLSQSHRAVHTGHTLLSDLSLPFSAVHLCIQLTFESWLTYPQPVPICVLILGLRGHVIHSLAAFPLLTYHCDTVSRCRSQVLCSFRFPPIRMPDILPPAPTDLTSRLNHFIAHALYQ